MSLLDGPDTVLLQLRKIVRDGRAARAIENDGTPLILKRVTVRPLSDVELNNAGTEAFSQKVVVSRTWDGDINTQVIWNDYDWDTIGEPTWYPGSRTTRHFEVRIERRGPHDG